MKTDNADRENSSDRHLVTEQPGMVILVVGMAVSLFFGITIKSLLSPARVAARIEKAAGHIHKDVQVKFSSAQISLQEGILPRLSVLITNVRMESSLKCWGAPVLEVDELRLPFSVTNWLRGRSPLRRVTVNTMGLHFREDFEECEDQASLISKAKSSSAVSLSPTQVREKYQNDVQLVEIRQLKVSSRKQPQYAFDIGNIQARVKSFEPQVIELRAKTQLLQRLAPGDSLNQANIYIEYKESPSRSLQSHVFGNWREGHYSIIGNYSIDDDFINVESDLKHIPLSQILAILKKYNVMNEDFNSRQLWVSSKTRWTGVLSEIRKTPLEIRDIRLEGDMGEIYSDKLTIESFEPLKHSAMFLEVRRLDVAKLLGLLNRPQKASFLGSLGSFQGSAEVKSNNQVKLQGELAGLEFLFANKGQSETQVIDRISLDASWVNQELSLLINRMEPRGGLFVGDLSYRKDYKSERSVAKVHIEELSLGPNIQNLMTNGGEIGSLSLDGEARFREGLMYDLKADLRSEAMSVEGVRLERTKILASKLEDAVLLNTQIGKLTVAANSAATEVLKKVTLEDWWAEGNLQLQSVSGKFEVGEKGVLGWKGFTSKVDKQAKFSTSGSWNSEAQLQGRIQAVDGKTQLQWDIQGTREEPVFVKEEYSRK